MADEFTPLEDQLRLLFTKIRKRSSSPTVDQWTLDGEAVLTTLMLAVRARLNSGGAIVPPPASTVLTITTQPTAAPTNGVAFATQPVIQLRDGLAAPISEAGVVVTAALASGSMTLGGTLTATTNASGVATFTNLVLTGTIGACTIGFSSPGKTGVTSSTVTPVAGAATTIVNTTTLSQTIPVSTNVTTPPVTKITDTSGNVKSGVSVTYAITAQGGTGGTITPSVQPVTSDASGLATLTAWATSNAAGTDTVTATSAGLSGSPVTFNTTVTSGFARKPSVPNSWFGVTLPTPTATRYIRATGGSDSNDGLTHATGWATIGKAETSKAAGWRIYGSGTFTGSGNNEHIGAGGASGTQANPIQYIQTPAEATFIVNTGGGANAWNPIWASAKNYHYLENVTLTAPSGADGGSTVQLIGGSHHWTFQDCTFNSKVYLNNAPDVRLYEPIFAGTNGNGASNSGDPFVTQTGSHRFWVIRGAWTGKSYHSAGIIGNAQAGATNCNDSYIFDNDIDNTPAGGLQLLGFSNTTIVEWNRITDVGTNTEGFSPGSRAGIQLAASNNIIRFNWIDSCSKGIEISAYWFGILQNANDNHIHNNTITRCTGRAFTLFTGAADATHAVNANTALEGNTVECNIIWANNTGTANEPNGFFESEWFPLWMDNYQTGNGSTGGTVWTTGTIGGNIFRYNLLGRSTADTKFAILVRGNQGGNTKFTKTSFESTFAGCSNNLAATDPVFVSAADVHLQAGSPCIDPGLAITSNGVAVTFLGTSADMGLYERLGSD